MTHKITWYTWSRETTVDVNFDLDGLRVSHMESRKSFTFKTVAANGQLSPKSLLCASADMEYREI